MPRAEFVHLHLHTQYSLLDGATRIEELMERAAQYQMPAVAVTDHGNLFGAVKFYKAAKRAGVKPILGCEVYVAPGGRRARAPGPQGARAPHLVLLAEDQAGYHNLVQLVSQGFLEGFYYHPRIDRELLERHSQGLIALSACLSSEVNEALLEDQAARAREAASYYKELFGPGRYFLELQDHGLPEDKRLIPRVAQLAKELDLPLVATNDTHYLERQDARAQEVLVCIQTGKTLSDARRMTAHSDQLFFKSPGEMKELFRNYPEAAQNTLAIAERSNVSLDFEKTHLPAYQVPPGYTLDGYLRELTMGGLERRLSELGLRGAEAEAYRRRAEEEVEVITRMGYSGYFLIVWDFIDFARRQGIPVGPGRGSAAGSLVAYCLRITDLDPLRYGLLFERFLNPERVTLPDIDVDFCMERRDEVVAYVARKYGAENVAQIITFGTMLAKGVIRDVGRVMDMSYGEVDRIAKLLPNRLNLTLEGALAEEPRLREAAGREPQVAELLETARALEGNVRHASTHAAGVVITPRSLTEYLPLYKDSKGSVMTQYDMKDVEALGLLKMDFLGLKTLTAIHKACQLVREGRGAELDADRIPLDDAEAYRLLAEGRTTGVFQLESRGVRDILRKLRPTRFEDLVAVVALYRPGPLGSGMVEDFIKRRHGLSPIEYELPQLEPILRDTYGVILYQEQVMQIASALAGFSMGRADLLRRAMGKKDLKAMVEQRTAFVESACAREVPRGKAERIFDLMEYFAGYGFNKSHSAAYALLAYRTAYLKARYPREFMASLLSCDRDNQDRVIKDIAECREVGIPVLPPDVNHSEKDFAVAGEGIRFGLAAVKNVGEAAVEAILERRRREGPFRSLEDLCRRVDLRHLNRRVVESLIKCGAFDSLGARRSQLAAALDGALDAASRAQRNAALGQFSLFGEGEGERGEPAPLPDVPEWPERERLAGEREMLGFYVTGHPLEAHRPLIRRLADCDSSRLLELRSARKVRLAGLIRSVRRQTTRKGQPMAYLTLEDLEGSLEVILFPDAYEKAYPLLESEEPLLVEGTAEPAEETVRVIAEGVSRLADAREAEGRVHVRVRAAGGGEEFLGALRRALQAHPGGCPVLFHLDLAGEGEVVVEAGEG
ncbi:MAG: DNA polymerase III subunit alpha, partial [Nitrospinota bacterium]